MISCLLLQKKYDVSPDDVQTYMMDNIEFDPSTVPFGAEACGCYVDGMQNG